MRIKRELLLKIVVLFVVLYSIRLNAENENYNIWQNDSSCEWGNNFLTPNVDFKDFDGTTIGSQIFHQRITNPVLYMQQRCLDVAKILYRYSSEAPKFRKLKFELKNEDFVAYKWGDGDEIGIAVSTQYLSRVYRDSGNDPQAVEDEVAGILFHEVTHGYNYSPSTGGDYDGSSPFWAYTEGIADAVRIHSGHHQSRTPNVYDSRKWLGGYTTTGFFLQYVSRKYDRNFLYKFNKAAKDLGGSWSFENSFLMILNKNIQSVWEEYKNFILSGGLLDYDGEYSSTLDCNFDLSNTSIKINKISFYPNPAYDQIHLEYNQLIEKEGTYQILNLLGKVVLKGRLSKVISIKDIAQGVYVLIVFNKNKSVDKKFIKR